MRKTRSLACLPLLVVPFLFALSSSPSIPGDEGGWTEEFGVEKGELVSIGRNPYFILEPGYQLTLEGEGVKLVITVTEQTKTIAGVETRVVEERETEKGELREISRNFYAVSKRTNSVFYFGEEVDIYKNGKIAGHDGSWLAGEKGARFGLMMPGLPLLKGRHYQEIAPGVAMDRAEIVSMQETVKTPAGEWKNCLKVLETTPIEPAAKESKCYAPGIGFVGENDELRLMKYGMIDTTKK